MTELIERGSVINKLKQGYFDKNLQQAKNDPCVIDAMIDWAIRRIRDVPIHNPWHTEPPTEEGWYVCKMAGTDLYETEYFTGVNWNEEIIEKWKKVEETD